MIYFKFPRIGGSHHCPACPGRTLRWLGRLGRREGRLAYFECPACKRAFFRTLSAKRCRPRKGVAR